MRDFLLGVLGALTAYAATEAARWWRARPVPRPVVLPPEPIAFVPPLPSRDVRAIGLDPVDAYRTDVPDAVVAVCVAEARGNHVILERMLQEAAAQLRDGARPDDVVRSVQVGERVDA